MRKVGGLKKLGDEGYVLKVRSGTTRIRARGSAGLFYAGQTLQQLLPATIHGSVLVAGETWSVPQVNVKDSPRFGWRGAHLDLARRVSASERAGRGGVDAA